MEIMNVEQVMIPKVEYDQLLIYKNAWDDIKDDIKRSKEANDNKVGFDESLNIINKHLKQAIINTTEEDE